MAASIVTMVEEKVRINDLPPAEKRVMRANALRAIREKRKGKKPYKGK